MRRPRQLAAGLWNGFRPRARSAAVVVFLFLAVTGANFLFTAHTVDSNARQRCSSLLADASIPLPHPIAGNPSREWEAAYEAIAAARARQLGCRP